MGGSGLWGPLQEKGLGDGGLSGQVGASDALAPGVGQHPRGTWGQGTRDNPAGASGVARRGGQGSRLMREGPLVEWEQEGV